MPDGVYPVLNMKKMRCLFLVLALGLSLCSQRAQGQTSAQSMTFSIICQYVTNTYTTNLSTHTTNQDQRVQTVLLNSGNLVKAMAIDMFGTNWPKWQFASIVYEQNLESSNQGIYLRYQNKQTNVSSFFTNGLSTNGFANMFSQDVPGLFNGTNYAMDGTNSILPLTGRVPTQSPTVSDDLAYLTFNSANTSFTLFGYSQGSLLNTVFDKKGDVGKVVKAQIIGAGTFSLNVTTNFLHVTNATAAPAINYSGLAHGTVNVNLPYHLNIGPPEGP
jgi:hypothetical protein